MLSARIRCDYCYFCCRMLDSWRLAYTCSRQWSVCPSSISSHTCALFFPFVYGPIFRQLRSFPFAYDDDVARLLLCRFSAFPSATCCRCWKFSCCCCISQLCRWAFASTSAVVASALVGSLPSRLIIVAGCPSHQRSATKLPRAGDVTTAHSSDWTFLSLVSLLHRDRRRRCLCRGILTLRDVSSSSPSSAWLSGWLASAVTSVRVTTTISSSNHFSAVAGAGQTTTIAVHHSPHKCPCHRTLRWLQVARSHQSTACSG